MKNVHLLLAGESYLSLNCSYRDSAIGTEVGKPYWTYSKDWKHHMSVTDASVRPHNIYITNDEEIKDGDYYLYLKDNSVQQFIKKHHTKLVALDIQKKIILTTDQDLIKDGVQAIDDEFLEWFVKNPSCEEVEVEKLPYDGTKSVTKYWGGEYKIIIPKEESKQQCKDCNDNLTDCTCIEDTVDMKQETPEEAFVRFMERNYSGGQITKGFVLGAMKFAINWKQEQDKNKFSEEDMMKAVKFGELYRSEGSKSLFEKKGTTPSEVLNRWFEQIKKK